MKNIVENEVMVDFDVVVNEGVKVMEWEGEGDGGVECWEWNDKFVVYSFDFGGSLGGEEVFDDISEVLKLWRCIEGNIG